MPIAGAYINLDRSPERRAAMDRQLDDAGGAGRYARFPAIDGRERMGAASRLTAGEFGCLLSHYECLKAAPAGAHFHVLEDDAVLSPHSLSILDQVVADVMDGFDLLFTEVLLPADIPLLHSFMALHRRSGMLDAVEPGAPRIPKTVHCIDLRNTGFAATSSYVVNGAALAKVAALIEAELARGPNLAIDMLYRDAINRGELRAACTAPFLTSVTPDDLASSTIRIDDARRHSRLAFHLLRGYFFFGKDEAELSAIAGRLDAELDDPAYAEVLMAAFRHILGGRFVDL